jgi:hypothetical protein
MVRATLVVASLAALGACASNHQRAWANGRNMTSSRAYWAAVSGDMSVRVHRDLVASADARLVNYTDLPYRPFASWW